MLCLVRELLGATVPDKIMAELRPADYQPTFFEKAMAHIFDANLSGQLFKKRIGRLLNIKKKKSTKEKVLTIFKGAFPSREYLASITPI